MKRTEELTTNQKFPWLSPNHAKMIDEQISEMVHNNFVHTNPATYPQLELEGTGYLRFSNEFTNALTMVSVTDKPEQTCNQYLDSFLAAARKSAENTPHFFKKFQQNNGNISNEPTMKNNNPALRITKVLIYFDIEEGQLIFHCLFEDNPRRFSSLDEVINCINVKFIPSGESKAEKHSSYERIYERIKSNEPSQKISNLKN